MPGAYLDVRQLQTNPVQYPIEIHVFGQADVEPAEEEADIRTLRNIAGRIVQVLRSTPNARRAHTDWMEQSPIVQLPINPDRAIWRASPMRISRGRRPAGLADGR